jgi:hypothetical protein
MLCRVNGYLVVGEAGGAPSPALNNHSGVPRTRSTTGDPIQEREENMVDSTTASPNGTSTEKMGLPARFFGIFFSPGRVFEHLKSRPVWFTILLVVALFIALFQFAFLASEKGIQIAKEQVLEQARDNGQTIPEETLETIMTTQKIAAPIAILILVPLFSVIIAGLIYLIFNIMLGGEATFRQVLSFNAHTAPITILQQGLTFLIIYVKGTLAPVTSLAAFLPFVENDTLMYRIAVGIDVFTIWQVGLLALGMSILYGFTPKKCATVLYGTYLGLVVVISLIIGLF